MTAGLKIVEDSPERLVVRLGWPWFNGSVSILDRSSGRASFKSRNIFIPFRRREVALSEIADIVLVSDRVGSHTTGTSSVAYPRVLLASGASFNLISTGEKPAAIAVPRMRAFLFGPDAAS